MISVDGLTVEFGGTTLFSDISFQINEKDRIALMGKTVRVRVRCSKFWQVYGNRRAARFPHPKTALWPTCPNI